MTTTIGNPPPSGAPAPAAANALQPAVYRSFLEANGITVDADVEAKLADMFASDIDSERRFQHWHGVMSAFLVDSGKATGPLPNVTLADFLAAQQAAVASASAGTAAPGAPGPGGTSAPALGSTPGTGPTGTNPGTPAPIPAAGTPASTAKPRRLSWKGLVDAAVWLIIWLMKILYWVTIGWIIWLAPRLWKAGKLVALAIWDGLVAGFKAGWAAAGSPKGRHYVFAALFGLIGITCLLLVALIIMKKLHTSEGTEPVAANPPAAATPGQVSPAPVAKPAPPPTQPAPPPTQPVPPPAQPTPVAATPAEPTAVVAPPPVQPTQTSAPVPPPVSPPPAAEPPTRPAAFPQSVALICDHDLYMEHCRWAASAPCPGWTFTGKTEARTGPLTVQCADGTVYTSERDVDGYEEGKGVIITLRTSRPLL